MQRFLTTVLLALVATVAQAGNIRIGLWDDTEGTPPAAGRGDARAQIWAKGLGSKSFLGPRGQVEGPYDVPVAVGQTIAITIYPDGRDAAEINVQAKLTTKMCPNGCLRDMLSVSITDQAVKVFGGPVKAQYGRFELLFDRRTGKPKPQ